MIYIYMCVCTSNDYSLNSPYCKNGFAQKFYCLSEKEDSVGMILSVVLDQGLRQKNVRSAVVYRLSTVLGLGLRQERQCS